MENANWKKSTKCESSMCCEVAVTDSGVAMRNNTAPDTHLQFDTPAWRDFIAGVRAGDFDAR